jgi:hypothetical protein
MLTLYRDAPFRLHDPDDWGGLSSACTDTYSITIRSYKTMVASFDHIQMEDKIASLVDLSGSTAIIYVDNLEPSAAVTGMQIKIKDGQSMSSEKKFDPTSIPSPDDTGSPSKPAHRKLAYRYKFPNLKETVNP